MRRWLRSLNVKTAKLGLETKRPHGNPRGFGSQIKINVSRKLGDKAGINRQRDMNLNEIENRGTMTESNVIINLFQLATSVSMYSMVHACINKWEMDTSKS